MWTRKTAIASSLPIALWPTVAEEVLSIEDREKFVSYRTAMQLYFANERVADVEAKTGVSRHELARMAQKCLLLASDGRIFGFRALIPYVRIRSNVRHAPFGEKRQHQQGGLAGVMNVLLERFPDLEKELTMWILADAKLKKIHEKSLRPKDLHRIFIQYVKSKGVPETEWPFTTQHRGIRTIQKFMASVLDRNFSSAVQKRGGSAAKAHLNVGTGDDAFLLFEDPYDAVEIDAYKIDSHLTAVFKAPAGNEIDILLERLWLIAVVERASSAILAYTVVYRSEICADDILKVIRDAVTSKWRAKELSAPYRYPLGGGLPNGVIPEAFGACWSVTFFDGALAHLSQAVYERVRTSLGVILNWGAPGHFERRPHVERTFRKIADDLFKRLPSTTGSNPQNGRAEDGEQKAIRHRIRAAGAEEMLDVYVAQHNVTPHEGICWATPMEFIRNFLDREDGSFLLRLLPEQTRTETYMFAKRQERTVRGGRSDGRKPYVQLDRVHYTSPVLAQLGNLIGKQILVEIDEDDYRQVKAYLKNGAELGFLTAQGKWSRTKHSRRTRLAINSLIHRRIIVLSEFDDPIQVYLSHLSTPTSRDNASTPVLTRRQATDATRTAEEAGLPRQISEESDCLTLSVAAAKSVNDIAKGRSLMDKPPPLGGKIRNSK